MAWIMRRSSPIIILLGILCLDGCRGEKSFVAGINMALPKPEFTFGLVADAQYADCDPAMNRYYRASLGKLAACVEDFNRIKPEFVVDLGDLIDRDFESFGPMMAAWAALKAPLYHVIGNHDAAVGGGDRERVGRVLGMGNDASGRVRRYYDFAQPDWRFIVLDGNELSLYATAEGSPERGAAQAMLNDLKARGAVNAQEYNGGLGTEQLDWLRARLAEAGKAGERVIVFCHFPIWPDNVHNLWNAEAALAVIDAAPQVVAWISGHYHAGSYSVRLGGGQTAQHHLTLRGMVETPDQSAYSLVEVWPGRLCIDGRGTLELNRDLPLK